MVSRMLSFEKKDKGFITKIEFKNSKVRLLYCVFFLILLLLSFIFIVPTLWMILSAFKDTQEFLQVPPTLIPKSFDINKIATVWSKTAFGKSFLATLIMVLGNLIFCLVCNGLAGYVLSRLKPKGSGLIMALVLWTMMMPENISMVPRFMTFKDFPVFHFSLIDSYWPMWLMEGANAFYVLIFKSFFDTISQSYIEAARIDGCSDIRVFTSIILPLSKPVFMSVSIFTVTHSWGSFFWPYLVVHSEYLKPVGVKIFTLQPVISVDEYIMSLVFVIVPPVIFFLLFQKNIMEGVSLGGIKG